MDPKDSQKAYTGMSAHTGARAHMHTQSSSLISSKVYVASFIQQLDDLNSLLPELFPARFESSGPSIRWGWLQGVFILTFPVTTASSGPLTA